MTSQETSKPTPSLIHAPLGIIAGAMYPFKALKLLQETPQLWGYVLIPIVVNILIAIALYIILLFPSLQGIDKLVLDWSTRFNSLIVTLPNQLHFISIFGNIFSWLVHVILVTVLLLIVGFLSVQFGVVLGAPWYGQLSEQLEKMKIGQLPDLDMSLTGILREIQRAFAFELGKLKIMVIVGLPLFLLNFIPGLGSAIATVGGVILGTTLVSLDFLSAPLDRRKFEFKDKLNIFRESLPASGSFGLVCFGLVSIPFLGLLAIPLCVVAGTLFFCDRVWPHHFAEKESKTNSQTPPESIAP
jgi:CysZ protein